MVSVQERAQEWGPRRRLWHCMRLSFEYLSSNITTSLLARVTATCGSMDEQELGNTVWALGQIGHGIRGQAGDALMNAVVKNSPY
jgi:hypothetical protein